MRQAMKRAAKLGASTTRLGVESCETKAPKIRRSLGSKPSLPQETKTKAKRQPKKLTVVDSCKTKAAKTTGNLESKSSPETKTKVKRQPKKLKVVDSGKSKGSLLGAEDPLVSLGALCQGRILRRPSQQIKSPYVADVKLDPEFGGAEVIHVMLPFTFHTTIININLTFDITRLLYPK